LLPPHSTPLQFFFLFLQLQYHHIPLHHYFFSCFCNFVTTAFHCLPRMLLSRMDSFKKKFKQQDHCWLLQLFAGVANHKSPLLISYCFVALFFIFCCGKNVKKVMFTMSCMFLFQIVDKVLNSPDSRSIFLNLNSFYFDAFVAKATI
jgi:hypothetical protein